jgi:glycerol-3-phosphate dehydrogenase
MPLTASSHTDRVYDVIVIGGGITGAGVARDCALRGLSCLLLEKQDFASGVTSKTTRLIHGGLRYLANFEVGLVAESLRERANLRRLAPHLIRPIPIVIPIYQGDAHGRAAISFGIHLYDLLSHERDVPHYFTSGRERTLAFEPRLNQEGLSGSALFYDHQIMMPERLVIENIVSAREAGATVLNHVRVESLDETGAGVDVYCRDATATRLRFRGRVAINAAGPWIDQVRQAGGIAGSRVISPTKGIHLVMPRLSDQALFAASRDGRMIFVIPLGGFSLIGTTDTRYDGDLDQVHADRADVEYLLAESSRVLPGLNINRDMILYTYAGIRPLAFSGPRESKISRKHRVIREGRTGRVLTIAGGKLTTYRAMAKDVVDAACAILGVKKSCTTDKTAFPGGLPGGLEEYVAHAAAGTAGSYTVDPETVRHLITLYGSRSERLLELVRQDPSLANRIAPDSLDIFAQIVYSIREEGARTLSDVVLRRMHLGMTADRGLNRIGPVAEVAARELGWNRDEARQQVEEFRKEINRDLECLK